MEWIFKKSKPNKKQNKQTTKLAFGRIQQHCTPKLLGKGGTLQKQCLGHAKNKLKTLNKTKQKSPDQKDPLCKAVFEELKTVATYIKGHMA